MKLRTIMVAALAALTLAACSKDDKGGGSAEGEKTTFGLSITLPQNMGSRANGTQNATATESYIGDNIYIYVFNTDGTPADGDAYKALSLSSDFQKSGNTYTLIDELDSKSGDKIIYAAANVPAALVIANPSSEDDLLAVVNTSDLIDNNGYITMFGRVEATLGVVAYENNVEVGLERTVAKVVATIDDAIADPEFTVTWDATTNTEMKITVKEFFVVQDAYKSYFAPAFYNNGYRRSLIGEVADVADVLNVYDHYTTNLPVFKGIDTDKPSARETIDGFYIGENIPNGKKVVARYNNTTYAYVKTSLALDATAVVTGNNIEYTGPGLDGTEAFTLVRVDGGSDYICLPGNNKNDILAKLDADGIDHDYIHTYDFLGGYVYYRVFLNKDEASMEKYNVYRNQFINIVINGISVSEGDFGKGYPDTDGDGDLPIDPNNPDKGENPNPPGGGGDGGDNGNLTEDDATLKVTISVKPWDYAETEMELGGDEF
ncbi:MAG: hypothetical protein LIO77_09115 [Rikenellaceae bacterium]|nr:hypothetical protein [Rikenellaceae bacterium]